MANSLTETERHSIEYHLGWVQDQQVLAMGGNVTVHEVVSLLRANIERADESKVYRVREALCECQRIQDALKDRSMFGVRRVGDVEVDPQERIRMLEDEYTRWTDKLADMFGGHKNAYSLEHQRLAGPQGLMDSY